MAAKVFVFLLFIGITTGTNLLESCNANNPECNCEYKYEPCPGNRPRDCSSEYECPLETNKPCCYSKPITKKPCPSNFPECNCEYKDESCPSGRPIDCSSEYECPVETNKPCCLQGTN